MLVSLQTLRPVFEGRLVHRAWRAAAKGHAGRVFYSPALHDNEGYFLPKSSFCRGYPSALLFH